VIQFNATDSLARKQRNNMFNRKKIVNLLISLATIMLMAVFGEIMVRLSPSLFCEGYRPSPNNKIVYELYPGYEMKSLKAKISSQGLNDRYFAVKKQPDVFRIAVVGDSMSFGWKVGAENSFPKVLERMLNKASDRKFEVLNFSVPGYNTSQEFEVIKEKVLDFQPDLIILVFCYNDTHICNFIKPDITIRNYLFNHSYLTRFLLRKLDLIIMNSGRLKKIWFLFKNKCIGMLYYDQVIYPYPGLEETICLNGNPPDAPEQTPERYWHMLGYENYRVHLRNINDLLKEHSVKLISCGQFTKKALKANNELGIKNICDFKKVFEGKQRSEFLIEWHYNKEGNVLIASYLYNFLNESGLLIAN